MIKIGLLFALLLLMSGRIGYASAEAGEGTLSVESVRYECEPAGVPVIRVRLENQGSVTERPVVAMTINQAYSNGQDAYRYRKKGVVRPDSVPVIPAGGRLEATMHVPRILEPGNYEAVVDLKYEGNRTRERMSFSVTDTEYQIARLGLKRNHLSGYEDEKRWPSLRLLIVSLAAGLAIIVFRIGIRKR